MLVTMSQKELNHIPVLQQICDKRLTKSAAAKRHSCKVSDEVTFGLIQNG